MSNIEDLPPKYQASVIELYGYVNIQNSNYSEAIKAYEKLKEGNFQVEQHFKVKSYLNYALIFWNTAEFNKYYKLTSTAYQLSQDEESYANVSHSLEQQHLSLSNLIEYHQKITSDWKEAFRLNKEHEKVLTRMMELESMSKARVKRALTKAKVYEAIVYRDYHSDLDKAITLFREAATFESDSFNNYGINLASLELAKTYYLTDQVDSASVWLQRVSDRAEVNGDPVNLLKAQARLLQIGIRNQDEQMIAEASSYIDQYESEVQSEEVKTIVDLAMIDLTTYRGENDKARTIAANLVDRLPRMDASGNVVSHLQWAIEKEKVRQGNGSPSREKVRSAAIEMLLTHQLRDPFLGDDSRAGFDWRAASVWPYCLGRRT